jgi:hypothetical protein
MIFQCTKLHVSVQRFMSSPHKIKHVFQHSMARHVRFFKLFIKVVLLKVVYPLKLSAYKISWFQADWCSIHVSSLKIPLLPYSKGPSKIIIIQTKLVGMSILFHCTELHLSKYNGSWVLSIKQNVNFKFKLPCVFVFFVFRKTALLVVHPLNIYQNSISIRIQNLMVLRWLVQVLQPPLKV